MCLPELILGYPEVEAEEKDLLDVFEEMVEDKLLEKNLIQGVFVYQLSSNGVYGLSECIHFFAPIAEEERISFFFLKQNEDKIIVPDEDSFLSEEILEKLNEFSLFSENEKAEEYLNSLGDGRYCLDVSLDEESPVDFTLTRITAGGGEKKSPERKKRIDRADFKKKLQEWEMGAIGRSVTYSKLSSKSDSDLLEIATHCRFEVKYK